MYSKGKKKGRAIKIIFIASEFEENLTHFRDILEFFSHRLWWLDALGRNVRQDGG